MDVDENAMGDVEAGKWPAFPLLVMFTNEKVLVEQEREEREKRESEEARKRERREKRGDIRQDVRQEARGERKRGKEEKRKERMSKDTRPTERSQLPKEEGVATFRPYSGFTRADRKKNNQEE
ncbi:hypothetical protein BOTCAL_0031g00540 [Botryotinia calthae]|uniref:Uncharacterized protein n=1 Tax=Botryotinia calthae TaxID=38488 RepID=A0A4Y8DDL0_9HELO|nr:hypothetical protein BOTCAL_0031g00540 [Botryotinia calthae]